MSRNLLLFCIVIGAVSVAYAQTLPQDLPAPVLPSSIPTPLATPAGEVPPASAIPVAASIPTAPEVKPDKPSEIKKATDNILNLIQNPEQLGDVIEKVPETVPRRLEKAKENIINLASDPNRFNGNNFEVLGWRNSLMFAPADLQRLYNAAKGLTDQSVGAVMVAVKVPRAAPAFFLNSVLYNTANNWTIWLNSRRIRSGSKFPELEISNVNRDTVEFIWETEQLDFISPGWEAKIMPIPLQPGEPVPRFAYQSKDGLIAVDRSRRFVKFILGPHQTFVSKEMKIAEGYVRSTFFESTQNVATQGGQTPIQVPGQQGIPAGAPTAPAPVIPTAPVAPPVNPLNPLAIPPAILQAPLKN